MTKLPTEETLETLQLDVAVLATSKTLDIINTVNVFRKGLTMASLNINSLLAHIDDLRVFIENSNIDILAINETQLDSSVDDDQVYLTGFDIIRKDRLHNGRSGGGVCIYLRSILNFRITLDSQTLIDLCITNSPDKITSLGISDHSPVYLVRKSNYPKWGRVISQLLEEILNISMKPILCLI